MFTERHPTSDSPGLQYAGISAKLDVLIPKIQLSKAAEDLRLTTPTIHTAWKLANNQELTSEELEIVSSFTIKRGPRDWLVAPMVNGMLDGDSGILSTLEFIKSEGLLDIIPKRAEDALYPDQIMFSGFLRWQPISVLWDLADGVSKASPFGAPKPWVIEELQILGFITIRDPIPDGTTGRPPKQLIPTSWGKRFVELTRKRAGFEVPDAYRQAARRRSGNRRARFNTSDQLVSGYLAKGQEIPPKLVNRMSEYGKQELSKAYGVEL